MALLEVIFHVTQTHTPATQQNLFLKMHSILYFDMNLHPLKRWWSFASETVKGNWPPGQFSKLRMMLQAAHQLWKFRLFTHLQEQNTRSTKEDKAKNMFELCFRSNRRLELLFRMIILYFSSSLYSWRSDLITRISQFSYIYQTSSICASLSSFLLNIYK